MPAAAPSPAARTRRGPFHTGKVGAGGNCPSKAGAGHAGAAPPGTARLNRWRGVVGRLPRYASLARRILALGPRAGGRARRLVLAGLAYWLVPLDPLPGFIPVLGQLDDLLVALFALRLALRSLPRPLRTRLLREAGLDAGTVESDWRLVRETARDLVVASGRVAWRLGWAAARGTARLGTRTGAWLLARMTARRTRPKVAPGACLGAGPGTGPRCEPHGRS